MKDWLFGLRSAQPDRETQDTLNALPPTESERYRIVHHLITGSPNDGGANITPKSGKWKNVESILPLHDNVFNKHLIKKWSSKTFLNVEDLDEIRDRLGEKVCFRKYWSGSPLTVSGRLLFCFHAIVLCFPSFPCHLWLFRMGSTRSLQLNLWNRQHSLVRHFC